MYRRSRLPSSFVKCSIRAAALCLTSTSLPSARLWSAGYVMPQAQSFAARKLPEGFVITMLLRTRFSMHFSFGFMRFITILAVQCGRCRLHCFWPSRNVGYEFRVCFLLWLYFFRYIMELCWLYIYLVMVNNFKS